MTHRIELYLGNRIYSGWKELSITRSLEEVAGQFTLGVTVNTGDSPLVLKAGTACKLEINGQRIITGYVDTVEIDVEGTSRTTTVTGRDKTGDLVDCAAIHGKGQWRNVSLATIAQDVCRPFGVSVIWQVQLPAAAAKFKVWQIEPGETVFDMLSRAARHRGVLITSNANGDLVFTTASKNRAGTLILGTDSSDKKAPGTRILSLKTHLSWAERFSLFRVKGGCSGGGLWGRRKQPVSPLPCMLMWLTLISPATVRRLLSPMTTSPKTKVTRGEAGNKSGQWPIPPLPAPRCRIGLINRVSSGHPINW